MVVGSFTRDTEPHPAIHMLPLKCGSKTSRLARQPDCAWSGLSAVGVFSPGSYMSTDDWLSPVGDFRAGFRTDLGFKRVSRESPLHRVRKALPADRTAWSKAQKVGPGTVHAQEWVELGEHHGTSGWGHNLERKWMQVKEDLVFQVTEHRCYPIDREAF